MSEAKQFDISKKAVIAAFQAVKENAGSYGVDEQTIKEFEEHLNNNLYKLWNRMASGSYFPKPVRAVEIPKKNGDTRILGIPTVEDRIAQMVAKMYFEPLVEPMFYNDSYGYRPNKSAIQAVGQARERCFKRDWVLELDIKGLFDNIKHGYLMYMVEKHTQIKWLILYIKRWLTVPFIMSDGSVAERRSGTPQGGLCRARHNTSKNATLCYSVIIKKERSQKLMNLEMITEGLKQLLQENNYSSATIRFYEGEWNKIQCFLTEEYGNTEYDMERGLKYLEKQYGFITKYNNGTLSQQRVQLLRVVHMLEDYRLHQVLTRRYYASKNPITLNAYYLNLYTDYLDFLNSTELSASTIGHYKGISRAFMDYLQQRKIGTIENITMDVCNSYLKTLAGYSFKTIEQNVCGIRHFLRFIYSIGILSTDYAEKIHMPAVSKSAKIPSAWKLDELKAMLSVIDRNSPIGKRDYAMILLACVLGLRIGDIKNLRFQNFNWEDKKLSLIQHKTHKPLTLPIPDAVGWAVIDYIKNGRPQYYESDQVFLKHMPPFDPIGNENHMQQQLVRYMRKAGIDQRTKKHSGFHSLRHSAGSMLLEMETPLPVITDILGHSDSDVTAVYLKTDLQKLAECVLSPEEFCHG